MNLTGVRNCKNCKRRAPYDRMENDKYSKIYCLVCEKLLDYKGDVVEDQKDKCNHFQMEAQ